MYKRQVYTYNSRAQAFWQEQGVQRDTVPYELNEREIGKRDNTNSEMCIRDRPDPPAEDNSNSYSPGRNISAPPYASAGREKPVNQRL